MAGCRRVIRTAFLACGMAAMAGCGGQSEGDGTGGGSGAPGTTGSGGRGESSATGGAIGSGGRAGMTASGGTLGTGGVTTGAAGARASGGRGGTTTATSGSAGGGHAGASAGGTIGTGAGGARANGGRAGGGGGGAAGAIAGGGRGGTSATGGTTGTGGARATGGSPGGGGTCGQQTGHGPLAASSTFYQDISCAPVDSESSTIMQALQASGWGSGLGIDVSFNVLNADSTVARRAFENNGDAPDCDTAPVPLPAGGAIEGHSDYHCSDGEDCHLLVYQGSRLYELYQADVTTGSATGGSFSGGCLVVWDLTHDYWQPAAPPNFSRGDHCNGADAADMPIAPLLLTGDDIKSGEVAHALRFTLPNPHIRASVYVHPATHIGGPTGGADQLPYGARLRLRKDFDLSSLPSEQARMVARALQRYGMFLTDGGNLYVSGTTDLPNLISTQSIRSIKATDFEMVDGGQRLDWSSYKCQRTVISN